MLWSGKQTESYHIECAKMTCDEVAEKAVRAVEKGRLYCVPQGSGKFWWINKRLTPEFHYGFNASLSKRGLFRPFFMWLARRGLVQ